MAGIRTTATGVIAARVVAASIGADCTLAARTTAAEHSVQGSAEIVLGRSIMAMAIEGRTRDYHCSVPRT